MMTSSAVIVPERINPGDKVNTLTTIKKITSGSTPAAAEEVDGLYNAIIKAGTWKATSAAGHFGGSARRACAH